MSGTRPSASGAASVLFIPSGGSNIPIREPATPTCIIPQTSVGDFAADLGWYAVDDARRTLSIWGGLKAPTGKVADLTSDGAWDGALWAHGAMRWPKWRLAAELGIAQPFGDEIFSGAAHRNSVFGRFAATRAVGALWSVRAQLDGQTGHVAGTDLRFLGPSLQLSLGAARVLKGRWRIDMGFTEMWRSTPRRISPSSLGFTAERCKIAPQVRTRDLEGAPMYKTKIDLSEKIRRNVIAILNDRLADAIDLQSQVKQAHWNVKGPNFIALHELFDKISDVALEQIDEIAERITALGARPRARWRSQPSAASSRTIP